MKLRTLGACPHDGQTLFGQLHAKFWFQTIVHFLKIYFSPSGNFDGFIVQVTWTSAFICLFALTKLASWTRCLEFKAVLTAKNQEAAPFQKLLCIVKNGFRFSLYFPVSWICKIDPKQSDVIFWIFCKIYFWIIKEPCTKQIWVKIKGMFVANLMLYRYP